MKALPDHRKVKIEAGNKIQKYYIYFSLMVFEWIFTIINLHFNFHKFNIIFI